MVSGKHLESGPYGSVRGARGNSRPYCDPGPLYGGMDEPEIKIIDVFICKLRRRDGLEDRLR